MFWDPDSQFQNWFSAPDFLFPLAICFRFKFCFKIQNFAPKSIQNIFPEIPKKNRCRLPCSREFAAQRDRHRQAKREQTQKVRHKIDIKIFNQILDDCFENNGRFWHHNRIFFENNYRPKFQFQNFEFQNFKRPKFQFQNFKLRPKFQFQNCSKISYFKISNVQNFNFKHPKFQTSEVRNLVQNFKFQSFNIISNFKGIASHIFFSGYTR